MQYPFSERGGGHRDQVNAGDSLPGGWLFPRSQTPSGNAIVGAILLPNDAPHDRDPLESAMELPQQVHSQMEFGNEVKEALHRIYFGVKSDCCKDCCPYFPIALQ